MLSHVKYRNSIFKLIQKKFKYLGTPMLKTKYLLILSVRKNLQCPILHKRAYGVGVYTLKQIRIENCLFFMTDYNHSNFAFKIGVPT